MPDPPIAKSGNVAIAPTRPSLSSAKRPTTTCKRKVPIDTITWKSEKNDMSSAP